MKDEGEKRLWNLRSQLREAPEARHVAGEGLPGDPERPLNEAVNYVGDPKVLEMSRPWDGCQGELHIGSGTSPREVLSSAGWKDGALSLL